MRLCLFVLLLVGVVAARHSDADSPRQIHVRSQARKSGQETYSLCSFPKRHLLTVSDVTIEHQTAKIGDTITVTVQGSLKEDVEDGETNMSISWGVITLKNVHSTVCDTMNCPVRAGPFTYSQSFPIEDGTPNGDYTISYQVMGKEHKRVTCIEFDIHISS